MRSVFYYIHRMVRGLFYINRCWIYLVFVMYCNLINSINGQSRCGYAEIEAEVAKSEMFVELRVQQEEDIKDWIRSNMNLARTSREYLIPVVVHVVWNKTEENIDYTQIQHQIEVLNRDFAGLDVPDDLPEEFETIKARTSIQFCLAIKTPDNQITNGVTRTFTSQTEIGQKYNIYYDELGGKSIWNAEKYLNIWVCNFDDSREGLGFARPPYLITRDSKEKDGVVIDYRAFGMGGTALAPNDRGRTLVHEIAHYLNIRHLWKENTCADDGVEDTPIQAVHYIACPTFPQASCGSIDMPMNFMDYVDDSCMHLFTEGQMQRMIAVLNTARRSLIQENAAVCNFTSGTKNAGLHQKRLNLFPNPVSHTLEIDLSLGHFLVKYWKISDFLGREIQTGYFSAEDKVGILDVSHLSSGMFYLAMGVGGHLHTGRFIKQ